MRSIVAFVAPAAALGTLAAFGVVRLGGALEQLRALDVRAAGSVSDAPDASTGVAARRQLGALQTGAPDPEAAAELRGEPTNDAGAAGDARADDGAFAAADRHIQQWLVSDPEFMRAADELLREPDPQTQLEARRLLRELGADVAEPSGVER